MLKKLRVGRGHLFWGSCAMLAVACSGKSAASGFSDPDGSISSGGGSGGTSGGGGLSDVDGSAPTLGGSDSGPNLGCQSTAPNNDMDKDGFTVAQGDCNDCDPNVNPGAIDVLHQNDGGPPTWGDENCDGKPGDNAMLCDTGLALTDTTAMDGAKAIDLCATTTATERTYGVISAAYVRSNGDAFASPGAQVGIQSGWGTNVHVQEGANMLALSSGYARTPTQAGACGKLSCTINATATPPTGFPQDDPKCPKTTVIADDVALELQIRVPTNATGYSFNFKFYSFEYPDYVCDPHGYNDQFIALVTPAPMGSYVPTGSTGGNISFDSNNNPVSVNLGYFDTCDPATPKRFASQCTGTCPTLPSPYCPAGTADLAGTGFDVWDKAGAAGATKWLTTEAPATPGSIVTIRFALWDAGNGQYDSTVLIDNFTWIATAGVTVATAPSMNPK
jgi:hypothetical protein